MSNDEFKYYMVWTGTIDGRRAVGRPIYKTKKEAQKDVDEINAKYKRDGVDLVCSYEAVDAGLWTFIWDLFR